VTTQRLEVARAQILAYRQTVGHLAERLPPGADSLRRAAWAGLQDSMPRAALLSIHARVAGAEASTWEDPSLVQVWGPRYSAFVVAARDRGVFTLGRLPDDGARRRFAEDLAARVHSLLAGRRMTYGDVGRALGVPPNSLRYAASTGRLLMRWDGARQPTIWTVSPPEIDPMEARLELARRHLHVFGPTTPAAFGAWAGIAPARARAAFDALAPSMTPVRTPVGDAWILARDEPVLRAPAGHRPVTRLLPSGDAFTLLQGADRELLVPDAQRRGTLWTPRVWPGGILVGGELVGTWLRSEGTVTLRPWRRLSNAERDAVAAEASSLPLPGITGRIIIAWASGPRPQT
jgi:Winged helix DNA-binding domain